MLGGETMGSCVVPCALKVDDAGRHRWQLSEQAPDTAMHLKNTPHAMRYIELFAKKERKPGNRMKPESDDAIV